MKDHRLLFESLYSDCSFIFDEGNEARMCTATHRSGWMRRRRANGMGYGSRRD
jgi:hypothetical protein